MLHELAANVAYFGVFLTAVIYLLGIWIQKKGKLAIFSPLLVSCVIIIVILLVTKIPYEVYLYGRPRADGSFDGTGAILFQNLLTPTTVCLAIPLYEKLSYLKKYPAAILGGVLAGTVACLGSVLALSLAFGLSHEEYITLLPKSITTAIGIGLSEELGGMVTVTIASIIITGIFGNIAAGYVLKFFRIHHPVAKGLACGTAAHAMGTAKARELGEVEEAMSGLAIAVAGLMTVILASIFAMAM